VRWRGGARASDTADGGSLNMRRIARIAVALLPLLWSLIFAVSSLLLWRRGWTLARSTAWAALAGAAGLLAAAVCLALFGQLGVAGRL